MFILVYFSKDELLLWGTKAAMKTVTLFSVRKEEIEVLSPNHCFQKPLPH